MKAWQRVEDRGESWHSPHPGTRGRVWPIWQSVEKGSVPFRLFNRLLGGRRTSTLGTLAACVTQIILDDRRPERSDSDLIAASLARDTAAFGELVTRHQNRLYHSLVHMLGSATDAQDVAQEAFVLAFQKLATFRGDAQFYSWLFRIAMNAAVNFRRKNRSLGSSIDATKERIGTEPLDAHNDTRPDQPLEQAETQRLVRAALEQMTEEFRIPLIMAEMEEMKYEEIAELLNCPIGTVRSRIHRGRAELREKLRRLLKDEQEFPNEPEA